MIATVLLKNIKSRTAFWETTIEYIQRYLSDGRREPINIKYYSSNLDTALHSKELLEIKNGCEAYAKTDNFKFLLTVCSVSGCTITHSMSSWPSSSGKIVNLHIKVTFSPWAFVTMVWSVGLINTPSLGSRKKSDYKLTSKEGNDKKIILICAKLAPLLL